MAQKRRDTSPAARRQRGKDVANQTMSLKDEANDSMFYHFETEVSRWLKNND